MATTVIDTGIGERARPLSPGLKVVLVGAPLVMALGRALLVPLDDQDWDSVMTSMQAHQARSNAGWLLAMAASGLLAATAVILARHLASTGRARAAMFALTTTVIGWASCAGICFGGIYLSVAATAPDRAAQVQVATDFNDAAATGVVFLMAILAAIGYIVLAVGLARASVVSKGAAVLIGLGGATTMLTMGGPVTVLLVLTSLLLTAGHAFASRMEA